MTAAVVEVVLKPAVVAAVAAHAAGRTPGVLRLESGIGGLAKQLTVRARHEVRPGRDEGTRPAEAGGVDVDLRDGHAVVQVGLAVRAGVPVTACAHEVQRRVVAALVTDVGLASVRVSVSVLDVALGAPVPDPSGTRS